MPANQSAKSFSQDLGVNVTMAVTAADLGGHTWDHVGLEVPTHTSGGTIYINASATLAGTFHRIHVIDPADGAPNVVQILQANGGQYQLPMGVPYQFLKVENTSGVTAGATFKFHVS